MPNIRPTHHDVRAIYDDDHSADILALFLDPTMTYTCAYFERDDMTLEEAQCAKLDLSLGKLNLEPGHLLFEVGCGYGHCAKHAAVKYGANVIAVTPSRVQARLARERTKDLGPDAGTVEIRNEGWETWHGSCDRIVSIGALEHIRSENYAPFFARCFESLPSGALAMIHCIVRYDWRTKKRQAEFKDKGMVYTHEDILFAKFIAKEVFPGGQLLDPDVITGEAETAGFTTKHIQHIGLHYARTLDCWAANLTQNKDEAIALKGQAIYDHYMRYLTGCAHQFRLGFIDLCQFTFVKP